MISFLNPVSCTCMSAAHAHIYLYTQCSECSQKLMVWKQDENKRKKRDKRKNAKANSIPKIIVVSEKPSNADNMKKPRKKK